eukprot:GFYU01000761.1.p1 GENE.GFYU01000761.1~~GFYU01000761.1.p1  ORF type:complete len:294 (-),score=81.16 GFYU01000761.1:115-996(-)
MDIDDLFSVRNNFYLGCYQMAINEGMNITLSNENLQVERDVFVYRSYIAQGNYAMVLDEVADSAATPLQAVKLFASYMASEDNRVIAVETLKAWLSDPGTANNPILQIVGGLVFCHEQDYGEALKCVRSGTTLEMLALMVQILLRMNRVDLAEKELKTMQGIDDDATLTQLCTAWVSIALGGNKIEEAYHIFQDLGEKYNTSQMLLNGQAACLLHMKRYGEAEKLCLEALSKSNSDPDTLSNLITCYLHLGKPQEVMTRYINQLKNASPNHPTVLNLTAWSSSFERYAGQHAL